MHRQISKHDLLLQIEHLTQRLRRSVGLMNRSMAQAPSPPEPPGPPGSGQPEQQPDAFIDTAAAFHALVEGIREGAAILSVDLTVLTCNRRLAEMLKLECEQVMGRSMLEFIPLEDQPPFQALLQSAPDGFQRLHLRLSGGNAFPLPVELVITSLTVRGARVYSLLATDLSRRRRAEEQLTFQAHLLANVSDAIVAMDEHFRITYWNSAAERLYGWMAAEVLGRTASEVIHPELSPEQQRELNERLAETGAFDNQSWHRRRDGGPIWMEARRTALRGPDGPMLGYVSVNRDMTERRRAEEALARQAALLDLTHDAIFVRDFESVITFWNRGAEKLYGWTNAQALGQVAPVLLQTAFPMPLPEIVAEVIRTGHWEGELVRTTREGRRITVSSRWALQQDAEGLPVGILETNNDVTERKRAEQALQALNAELEQRVVERTAELQVANQELKKEIAQRQSEILARERTEATLRDVLQSLEDTMLAARKSEELLRIAIEAAGMVAWTYDPQKDEAVRSVRTPDSLQILAEESFPLLGRGLEIVHPDDREKVTEALPRAIAGEPFSIEVRLLLPDGAVRWIATQGRLRAGAPGKPPLLFGVTQDITERKRAEETLKQLNHGLHERTRELEVERARWQGVVEGIADEVWVCDAEGKMSLINLPAVTQMGLEEFKDKTVEEVYAEVDILNLDGRMRPLEQAPLLRSLKGEIVRGEEIIRHRRTGKTRYRQFSSAPTRDAAGTITGAVAIVRDVTGHKQVEQALRQSNRRVTEILESIQDGFFAVDREWNFTYVNQRSASIIGLAPEELVGQNLWEKFPVLLGTSLERQYRTAMAERAPARFEVEGVLTGTNYDVRVNPSADGISVYSIDITERKRVEAERERLLAENQRRRAELDTIVTSIADGLIIYDSKGKITFTNAAAERMLGYSAADALPTIEERTAIVKPDSEDGIPLEPDQTPSALALRGETVRDVVLRLQRARWVRVSSAPLYDSAGNLQGAVSTLTDFTERKQAEERIRQLNRDSEQRAVELELANKELESFSYSVSHDLQTPLSSVSNFSQLLLQEQGLQLPAESLPYVQHIHDNALAMEQLIQGLLTFSRTTRQPVQKRTVSHADLVRQVWEEFIAARAGRQVELVTGELPDAQADPLLLKQVWVNLMSNAIKFTRRREVARIEIGSYREGDRTVCFIGDNGAGFDMADADKLFGVFQRLHSEQEYEGTGVGLAIVARIVHRHGGRVWADARVNEGATFYFTLE